MWGNKKKQTKTSEFFKGTNIFDKLTNSIFGKIKQTFAEIFTQEDTEQYTLPKVIVIGNESTGKSSLLESLTKCQLFPRDSKLCTKCPIKVKLTNGPNKYIVKCPSENGKHKIIELKNKTDIYDIISAYMLKLPPDYISESEILIDITDQDVPTFEFYDLPGIRTYPPESAEMTTKLCRKYLSDKNSIVLCVVPSTTPRLTSCQSIALISEMKMEHNCILALTMADKLQPDDIEELLIKRIIQTSDELDGLNFAGYIAVINRIHSDIHSLIENDTNEIKWFDENILQNIPDEYASYSQKIRNNITINNLVAKMDDLYNQFIHTDWKPRILKSINEKINILESKYSELGDEKIEPTVLNDTISECINDMYMKIRIDCYKQIASFEELFTDNKLKYNSTNEQDIVDCTDGNDEYYAYIKQLNDCVQKYTEFNISYVKNTINEYFKNEQEYKLERFNYVRNDLVNMMEINFNNLVQNNMKKIKKNVERHMILGFLDENYSLTYYNDVFKLYQLFVLYPLFKREISYNSYDYIESDEYQQKRKELLRSIEKTRAHYESISTLPNMSHDSMSLAKQTIQPVGCFPPPPPPLLIRS